MNSLLNYGSDDDCENSGDEKFPESFGGSSTRKYRRPTSGRQEDVNYDNVEMDMSEDSNDEPTEIARKPDNKGREERRPSSPRYSNNRDREEKDKRRDDDRDRHLSWRDRGSGPSSDSDRNRGRREDDKDKSRDRYRDNRDYKDDDRRDKYREREDKDDDRKSRYRDREEKDVDRRDRNRDDRRDRRDDRYNRDRKDRDRRRSRSRERKSRSPTASRRSRSKSKEARGGYSRRYERANNKMDKLGKMGIEIKTPDCQYITPAELKNSMSEENDAQNKDRFFMPGITGRFRDQIEKRKMLWQKAKEPENKPAALGLAPKVISAPGGSKATKVYEATTFADDKTSCKFKRLMGIKDSSADGKNSSDVLKKQEEMFTSMEQQYEVARTATHTMRGVGLGFGSFQR